MNLYAEGTREQVNRVLVALQAVLGSGGEVHRELRRGEAKDGESKWFSVWCRGVRRRKETHAVVARAVRAVDPEMRVIKGGEIFKLADGWGAGFTGLARRASAEDE